MNCWRKTTAIQDHHSEDKNIVYEQVNHECSKDESRHSESRRSQHSGPYSSIQNIEQTAKDGRRTTDAWHQVLWGSKQRVQGYNGWNAAQLCCPQVSTLTFQREAGVSCGIGLRSVVTMHPGGGRHFTTPFSVPIKDSSVLSMVPSHIPILILGCACSFNAFAVSNGKYNATSPNIAMGTLLLS